jgi:Protein of unknown function (DUF4242)
MSSTTESATSACTGASVESGGGDRELLKWGELPIRAVPAPANLPSIGPSGPGKGAAMPRYMVERGFSDGLQIPVTDDGAKACLGVVDRNAEVGVTWVHSYVSEDKRKTFCIYDGPSPEAVRKAAERSSLPVERITQVSVLDPYFYR